MIYWTGIDYLNILYVSLLAFHYYLMLTSTVYLRFLLKPILTICLNYLYILAYIVPSV